MKKKTLREWYGLMLMMGAISSSGAKEAPEGISASDWAGIRAAYEAERRVIREGQDGIFTTENPGQCWRVHFDASGFEVTPRHEDWTWGLELRSFGRSGSMREVTASGKRSAAEKNRLTMARGPGVAEWYINRADGLMHGLTLAERPAGDGDLVLRFAVRGKLKPKASEDGLAVAFRDGNGASVLNYSGLKVWDATGRFLTAALSVAGSDLALRIADEGAVYPVTIDPVAQQAFFKASNAGVNDSFGDAVAVSGDTVVVGAQFEASSAVGVNGIPNENATAAGAAYVFVRNGTGWSQQAFLKASNAETGDIFGYAVAVSGDTVVVGALFEASSAVGVNGTPDESAIRAGAAYVFVRNGTSWSEQAFLKASNAGMEDRFGYAVAISGDTVVVGAIGEASSAVGINGTPNENANNAGAAYVFVRNGTSWSQQAFLKASNADAGDSFGTAVSASGDTVVVGAGGEASSAVGINGTPNENANSAGAAYVFVRNGTSWSQQAFLKASNAGGEDFFGGKDGVSISGDTVVVGASTEDSSAVGVNGIPNENADSAGAAYVFVRNGTSWSQQAFLKASNAEAEDIFGDAVSVSGDTVVVGAGGEDSSAAGMNGIPNENALKSGAAYVFVRDGTSWSQQAFLKASNAGASDQFGSAVGVSGDTVVVGAHFEDSSAVGINGIPNENAQSAGAAYGFLLGPPGNDDFAAARVFTGGPSESYTGQSTGEVGEPFHVPPFNSEINSIWWEWTASVTGMAVFDTFGSNFDTVLAVYTGDSPGMLSQVAGNDDSGGDVQSQVSFEAVPGQTYRIAVDGAGNATGLVLLNQEFFPGPPPNDTFAQAIAFSGTSMLGGTTSATAESGEPFHAPPFSNVTKSIWWNFTSTQSGTAVFDTFGSNFDTVLAVYTGNSVDALSSVGSNDDDNGLQSRVTFQAVSGQTYRIAVDGANDASGSVVLNLNFTPTAAITPASGGDPNAALRQAANTKIKKLKKARKRALKKGKRVKANRLTKKLKKLLRMLRSL